MENDLYRFIADRDTEIIDNIERYCTAQNKKRIDVVKITFYFLETIKKKLDNSFINICMEHILENATEKEKKAFSKPYSSMIYAGQNNNYLKSKLKQIEKGRGNITELMFSLLNSKKTESEKLLTLAEAISCAQNELYAFLLTGLYTSEEAGISIKYINHVGDVITHIYTRAEFAVDYDIINEEYNRLTTGCDEPNLQTKKVTLSPLLDTERGRLYLDRAVNNNLVEITNGELKWIGTKQLLAYFAEKLSDKLKLSKKQDKDGRNTTNWKITEDTFGVKNLKSAKHDWMKTYPTFNPNGYEAIDNIFNE